MHTARMVLSMADSIFLSISQHACLRGGGGGGKKAAWGKRAEGDLICTQPQILCTMPHSPHPKHVLLKPNNADTGLLHAP